MQNEEFVQEMIDSYTPRQKTAVDELKALDKRVKTPALVLAYVLGVVGALVLGTGMCFALKVIGDMFALGVVIGVVGIALCASNYFIYNAFLSARKKKYAPRILELSKSIIGQG